MNNGLHDVTSGAIWEERWHPLREEWVIVAAHRQNRPWSGEMVGTSAPKVPSYVADCYLCPGNSRVSGAVNSDYSGIFVFDNDHPCVGDRAPDVEPPSSPVYRNRPADGAARVVCYSPRHDLSLAQLDVSEIEALIVEWQRQYRDLGARPEVAHVLVFENKGEVVGVSNPHPHCQIYATNFVFKTIETEVRASAAYARETGRTLLGDVVEAERADGRRLLSERDGAVAFLPYFARYPYEAYVAPVRSAPSLAALSDAEVGDFAATLKDVLTMYDNLWRMPFPYVMALHQAPTDGGDYSAFHFHAEFLPPLRKPSLLKYLAGPEIGGGNFLADTAPEQKAAELRAVRGAHYTRI